MKIQFFQLDVDADEGLSLEVPWNHRYVKSLGKTKLQSAYIGLREILVRVDKFGCFKNQHDFKEVQKHCSRFCYSMESYDRS